MAAKKKKDVQLNKWRVGGKVTVREILRASGKKRYRTFCQRAEVHLSKRIRSFDTKAEAEKFAHALCQEIIDGRAKELDPAHQKELKELSKQIDGSNLIGTSLPAQTKKITSKEILDVGELALKSIKEINLSRKAAGLTEYSVSGWIEDFKRFAVAKDTLKVPLKLSDLIEKFLKVKLGPNGGRGNKPLSKVRKEEWRRDLSNLTSWIGHLTTDTAGTTLRDTIVNNLNLLKVTKAGATAGQLLEAKTKEKKAQSFSSFGRWLWKDREEWDKNHLESLVSKFSVEEDNEVTFLSPAQTAKLFSTAVNGTENDKNRFLDFIPYLTFLAFAGMRPTEMFDPRNKLKRMPWVWMNDWKINSEVTGGILFTFNAKLKRDGKTIYFKWKRNRQPDLAPNGLEWMKYWAKRKTKNCQKLGTVGQIQKFFVSLHGPLVSKAGMQIACVTLLPVTRITTKSGRLRKITGTEPAAIVLRCSKLITKE